MNSTNNGDHLHVNIAILKADKFLTHVDTKAYYEVPFIN